MQAPQFPPPDDAILADLYPIYLACTRTDQIEKPNSFDELRRNLTPGRFGPDVRVWKDQAGTTGGYGTVVGIQREKTFYGRIRVNVRPALRTTNLQREIVKWGQARIVQLFTKPDATYICRINVARDNQTLRNILEADGFTIARTYLIVTRPLPVDDLAISLPAGITIRETAGMADQDQWIAAYDEAFAQHWASRPYQPYEYKQRLVGPRYNPAFDLVATAADGTIVGVCTGGIAADAPEEGWLHMVGVRPSARRHQIAHALLTTLTQRLQELGAQTVSLEVDTENETGAPTFFSQHGFRMRNSFFCYQKQLQRSAFPH